MLVRDTTLLSPVRRTRLFHRAAWLRGTER
jgi:hypothetical protein